MDKVSNKITLDLEKDEVHGWERSVCVYGTIYNVNKRLAGESFPPIEVVRRNGVYQLVHDVPKVFSGSDYISGGHCLSIASYISGVHLDAFLLEDHRVDPGNIKFSPIREISLSCYNNLPVSLFLGNLPDDVCSRLIERCEADNTLTA